MIAIRNPHYLLFNGKWRHFPDFERGCGVHPQNLSNKDEVRNAWNYTSISPRVSNIMHKGQFQILFKYLF